MNAISYLLQVNCYLLLFYGFYFLLLKKETFFTLNRIYLAGTAILSFCIPLVPSQWARSVVVTEKVQQAGDIVMTAIGYPDTAVAVSSANQESQWTLYNWLILLYFAGVAIFLLRLLVQLLIVRRESMMEKGIAWSFFGKIIIPDEIPGHKTILAHEEVHARQLHSLDVLLFELVAIVNWFNPVSYLLKKAVKHIHEFLADEEAAGTQGDKTSYAYLLVNSAFGISPTTLTSSFYDHSFLKLRIIMLNKSRSRQTALWKYGLSAPLFAGMIVLSSATVKSEPGSIIHKTIDEMTAKTENLLSMEAKTLVSAAADEPSGPADYSNFLKRNLSVKYLSWTNTSSGVAVNIILKNGKKELYHLANVPEIKTAETKYGKLPSPPPPPAEKPAASQPQTTPPSLKGVVKDADGKPLAGVNILVGQTKGVTTAADGSFTIPAYAPGDILTLNRAGFQTSKTSTGAPGGAVPKQYGAMVITMIPGENPKPVARKLSEMNVSPGRTNTSDPNMPMDFAAIEKAPEYEGGQRAMANFIMKNFTWPAAARDAGVSGKVILSFVVERDGSLSDIKVLRDMGFGTGAEVVRVMKLMPAWKPGTQGGKTVRTAFTLPIQLAVGQK